MSWNIIEKSSKNLLATWGLVPASPVSEILLSI